VLGQRTGYEQPQENQAKEGFADKPNAPIPFPKAADKTAKISGSGMDVLRQADRQFNEKDFIQGATAAFNMILTVDEIREVSILNVELADSVAAITVHFHTTQTRIARDEHGAVMDDSDTESREFIDIWTFERDLTLADPNWKLAETESADDDS
ncbi:MAG: TIM44-like domain-containing protein, partial [Candidatus Puniceispirillaceae bacterium]